MEALINNGFVVPEVLQKNPTTLTERHYDQIGFKTKPELIEYIEEISNDPLECNGGVVPLFESVFTEEQFETYRDDVKKVKNALDSNSEYKLKGLYSEWSTYQFSDHYPMWVRLQTDGSDAYLNRIMDS